MDWIGYNSTAAEVRCASDQVERLQHTGCVVFAVTTQTIPRFYRPNHYPTHEGPG